MSLPKRPAVVFAIGMSLAVLMWLVTILFLNQPQCPADYTQQQIDQSNCVVGANIGYGMGIFASIGITVITVMVALVMALSESVKNKKTGH